MSVNFKIKDVSKAEAYCLKYIGPKKFHLHNKIGGQGWIIYRPFTNEPTLTVHDEKRALMAILAIGDQ